MSKATDAAYLAGYEAQSMGRSYESCQYDDFDLLAAWQEGWQESSTDDIESGHWMGENPEDFS